jgi:hypothetical protein
MRFTHPDETAVASQRGAAVWKLAERSVLPLFAPRDDGHPRRIGSGILARLFGQPFIVTAGHVVEQIQHRTVHFAPPGRKLIQLANFRGYWFEPERGGRDMGLIPLSRQPASLFDELTFLPSADIGIEVERQPLSAQDNYIVCGWPKSNSTFKLDRPNRNIKQKSFTFHTGIATAPIVGCEHLSRESYLVLVFDPEQITVEGRLHNPPDPDGISGGAAFRVVNGTVMLAGIMTEHRKVARVMVATRVAEFVEFAQDVIDFERSEGSLVLARPNRFKKERFTLIIG